MPPGTGDAQLTMAQQVPLLTVDVEEVPGSPESVPGRFEDIFGSIEGL